MVFRGHLDGQLPLPDPSEGSGWKLKGAKTPVLSTSLLRKGEEPRGPAYREDSAGWRGSWWCAGPQGAKKEGPKAVAALRGGGREVPALLPMRGPVH